MRLTTDDAPLIQMDGRLVIVRLTDDADGKPRFVEIRRPNMGQLAAIYELAVNADDALPKPPPPPQSTEGMTESQLLAYTNQVQEIMRERNVRMHALESPHGLAFLQVLKMMTGNDYTMDDADPYFMNPKALRDMLAHWEAPLGGPALADVSAANNGAAAQAPSSPAPSSPDSPTEPTAGSLPGTDDSGQPDQPT